MNNKHEQDELKELIDEGFRAIDRGVDESTPSLQWFEQLVVDQQDQLKARFKREMILFLILACCLLTVFSLTLFQMPILFLLFQGLIFAGALLFIGVTYIKKVKRI
ncbi:YxlC family protein [Bacillus sp. NTK074B]|uniref:YxlC family protein n=1 Tax=Bacillus sp. NTK074B TaxID=2802174 RepID=UPI001A8EDE06|nr:YxlC family protein [Bacillus sp. NTK074B]